MGMMDALKDQKEKSMARIMKGTLDFTIKPMLSEMIEANKESIRNPIQSQSAIAINIIDAIYTSAPKEYQDIIGMIGNMAIIRIEQDAAFREKFDGIMSQIAKQYQVAKT